MVSKMASFGKSCQRLSNHGGIDLFDGKVFKDATFSAVSLLPLLLGLAAYLWLSDDGADDLVDGQVLGDVHGVPGQREDQVLGVSQHSHLHQRVREKGGQPAVRHTNTELKQASVLLTV